MDNTLIKRYLVVYNLCLTFGWAYVMYLALLHRNDFKTIWSNLEVPLKIVQTAAVFEIIHVTIKIVKTSLFLTFFQVASRVYLVWGVLNISPPSQVSVGVPVLLTAWTITEIIRYGYYFLNIIGMAYIIQWFRYTLFIVLYPMGVFGEMVCIYYAMGFVKEEKVWSVEMPNALNFAFDYRFILFGSFFFYIPLFPALYIHMLAQRKRILGNGIVKNKTS